MRPFIVADDALFSERLAHAVGDGINLRPSRRDDLCGARIAGIAADFDRIKVSGGNARKKCSEMHSQKRRPADSQSADAAQHKAQPDAQ